VSVVYKAVGVFAGSVAVIRVSVTDTTVRGEFPRVTVGVSVPNIEPVIVMVSPGL
jgi:hypothetical protein